MYNIWELLETSSRESTKGKRSKLICWDIALRDGQSVFGSFCAWGPDANTCPECSLWGVAFPEFWIEGQYISFYALDLTGSLSLQPQRTQTCISPSVDWSLHSFVGVSTHSEMRLGAHWVLPFYRLFLPYLAHVINLSFHIFPFTV